MINVVKISLYLIYLVLHIFFSVLTMQNPYKHVDTYTHWPLLQLHLCELDPFLSADLWAAAANLIFHNNPKIWLLWKLFESCELIVMFQKAV